jgi:ectoine hydroxylase-related dioxygenase (phytanoyl-CoA dioxygenase family)
MYLQTPYKISYDIKKYPFRQIVSEILEISEAGNLLEDLHKLEHYDLLVREKDQSTIWHKRYYTKYKEEFLPTYLKLVTELKEQLGYDKIIYQAIPTFRVQLAEGNVGVGEWHKDSTYNHGTSEVNFWMPFVDTNEQNTIWMESKEDKGDYRPYKVNYGEILVFSGATLQHGNKPNESTHSRVSVDFRLVDPNKFISNEAESINGITKFKVGGYFEKI